MLGLCFPTDYSASHDAALLYLHCSPARVQTGKFDGLNVFAATAAVKQRQGVTVAAEVQVCGG
jgi:hypothetical protein